MMARMNSSVSLCLTLSLTAACASTPTDRIAPERARARVADEAHPARLHVRPAAEGVEQAAVRGGVERVHGEVPPARVRRPVVGERHLGPPPEGLDVVAQRRHLERAVAGDHRDGAVVEAGRNRAQAGALRERDHLVRPRGGGQVDLVDALTEQADAHRAADRTRLVGLVHTSNALGTVNPVREVCDLAHRQGAVVLVDGAQAVAHGKVSVEELGADFLAFSAHKMYGPSGVGVLWGRADLLDAMPPWQGGGDMIRMVTFEKTTYAGLPAKFEAGTPNVAGAVGLGAALDYVEGVGRSWIAEYEADLLAYGTRILSDVPEVRFVGTAEHKAAVLSFLFEGVHPHDVGTILDLEGVAVRTGHHCAFPVMQHFGVPATTRASLALYNTREDLDALAAALVRVREVFGG